MNSADLVEKLKARIGEQFDGECTLTEHEALEIADRLEALEAWKAEAMEALRPFAAYKTADGIDGGDFLRIPDGHPVLFNGMGDDCQAVVNIGHFRAAGRLVAKEDGR